jgi:hypothetical protein
MATTEKNRDALSPRPTGVIACMTQYRVSSSKWCRWLIRVVSGRSGDARTDVARRAMC